MVLILQYQVGEIWSDSTIILHFFTVYFLAPCWFFLLLPNESKSSMFCIDKKEKRSFLHKVSCSEAGPLLLMLSRPSFWTNSFTSTENILWIYFHGYLITTSRLKHYSLLEKLKALKKIQGLMSHTSVNNSLFGEFLVLLK